MKPRRAAVLALGLALAVPAIASAAVQIGLSLTGRRVIYNENAVQHARRFSDVLVPVPDAGLEPLIDQHAAAQNLDPRLVKAVIQVESGYNAAALSNKGAIGLMQLMPDTARLLDVDPYDPVQNLRGGISYLRRMIDRFAGRVECALAAYNAGPGAVEKHGGVPPFPETRDYVERILSLYRGDAALRVPAGMGFEIRGRKAFLVRRPGQRTLITTAPVLR
ncbi:MAG TPA: lytic transglycosylase domain-containing protein [Thermoanaerobaculia bacterium]|nr:lytic transglycosylase domain-containing protein [Thermoanaerobaculia bacterium]